MQHIAIMNNKWKLIDKILSWEKTIESRWYKHKIAPWDKIKRGEWVYFKNSWWFILARAKVKEILQFELKYIDIDDILAKYWQNIAFSQPLNEVKEWINGKNYCILVFLEKPESIEPFTIKKEWFGNACAWLCVKDIEKIKLK